jgi:acetoin:2,6-dichlorophenolindophenol oxidoreductase subunit beta
MPTLAATIKEATRKHLTQDNGLLFAQCVSAVGWIGGTVPELTEEQGIVELPTSDVSNGGVVVGAALAGRRPIYVIRYQGFMWYNAASLLNYAAKSKYLWDVPCPVFVRGMGMEGNIGPVASGMNHSMVMHVPGMPVAAPLTPNEWMGVWNYFLEHDDPVYCSENRQALGIDYEMEDQFEDDVDVTIFAISISRLRAKEAIERLREIGIRCNLVNVVWLKPFVPSKEALWSLSKSKFGVVLDCDHTICGTSESLALNLANTTGRIVYPLGLDDRTAGFADHCDNKTPDAIKIANFVEGVLVK